MGAQRDGEYGLAARPPIRAGWLEHTCELLCALGLVAMIVLIAAEVLCRSVFGFSLQITDELGGYLLVAISFLSLSVSEAYDAFHHVEFVQNRLSPRSRLVSQIAFDLMSLAFCAVLNWQLIRFEIGTWHSGDVAPTLLATPLWIPRLAMPIGTSVVCLTLVKSIGLKLRRLRLAPGAEAAP
jgi:TRAP-type C4-dicarboxylate transport system permease small subunit